jgi:colanic acid/amylovoran biosynthesis glycosyltransferase
VITHSGTATLDRGEQCGENAAHQGGSLKRTETPFQPVALQRCHQFVGRTTNWLYDHLRYVPRYTPVILCHALVNRSEFPELKAWSFNRERLSRRIWHRVADRLYPSDWWQLKRLAPRVLHSHFGDEAVEDLALQQALKIPWVVSFYGADAYQLGILPTWRDMYHRVFDQSVRVLALGPAMKSRLEELGCPREKIAIHPLGVDAANLPSRTRVLRRGETLKLLFAGTFREKKGIPYLIEATSILHRARLPIHLTLVGDAAGKRDEETKRMIFRQIGQLGIETAVTHHSYLPFRELIGLALQSHVFVAPSVRAGDGDSEGTPFVLQQMMATGMPAIATLHSDIPYIFGEHAHMLVPERDALAISDRIQFYAENPDAIVTDGVLLRKQIRSSFSIQSCVAHLSDLYDQVLGVESAAGLANGPGAAEQEDEVSRTN